MFPSYKVKAYTLMELTVVLVLSSILFTMVYQALHFVQSTYSQFSNKNGELVRNRMLLSRLKKDCHEADLLMAANDEIRCVGDHRTIVYKIRPRYILRKQGILQDTFRLTNTMIKCYFRQQEVSPVLPEAIDELVLESDYQDTKIRVAVVKRYGADRIFDEQLDALND